MIRLYHGSNLKIEVPDLVHSKPFKDFGSGFYLSPDKQQAWDMAFQKVSQTQQGKAEVTEFLFDETTMTSAGFKVLSYPDYCDGHFSCSPTATRTPSTPSTTTTSYMVR